MGKYGELGIDGDGVRSVWVRGSGMKSKNAVESAAERKRSGTIDAESAVVNQVASMVAKEVARMVARWVAEKIALDILVKNVRRNVVNDGLERNKKSQTDRKEVVALGKQGVIGDEKDPERWERNRETGKKSAGKKVNGEKNYMKVWGGP